MSSGPTAKLIDELVLAVVGTARDTRARHVLAQALHGLVRQARAEQLLDMQRDAARAVGAGSRRETRALMRRLGACSQRQLRLALQDGEADRA
ncbi:MULTISPECIES: hypothetical protein [unclassified Janthinobacterium]|jgi:hypothetical protein|uniref:Uncharacterized protein n=1 Tax=Janthinobacterium lividum TaxID=29581 RepID=A0A1E8PQK2_9BURK|nr:hypothetical protein [Janthinobacterium sp. CG_23.4]MDH6156715.1 hypothetical protein [Janthinobacterium sp. CG_23.4]OFJ48190.1 hypothetical protein BA896_003530 [Janthinobacterium lividum]